MASKNFGDLSLDNDNAIEDNNIENMEQMNGDIKSDDVVEVGSDNNMNNSLSDSGIQSHLIKYKALTYRPQRTESPRTIKVTGVEERKARLTKYHVYIIEVEPSLPGVINVARRFNDFKWLRQTLSIKYPSIFVPPLPPSKILGRYESDFVEERRKDLERYLNRIEEIKPFGESNELKMFLSRPETTMVEGQKEIIQQTSERDLEAITKDLEELFPDLHNSKLNEHHSSEDVPRLKEFLTKIDNSMKTLEISANKLFTNLASVATEMNVFSEAFSYLYSAESNYPYKSNTERFDFRNEFEGWKSFQDKQTDIYFDLFLRRLRYEHQDISAFLELFKYLDKIENYYNKVKTRCEKWEALESAGQELQPKQKNQKDQDNKDEKDYHRHLTITTKIILHSEMPIVWKLKTEEWRVAILAFAQKHAELTQQMMQSWKSMEVPSA